MLDLNKTHVSTQTYGTLPFMPVELLSEGHMGKSADVSPCSLHRVVLLAMLQGPGTASSCACATAVSNSFAAGAAVAAPQQSVTQR